MPLSSSLRCRPRNAGGTMDLRLEAVVVGVMPKKRRCNKPPTPPPSCNNDPLTGTGVASGEKDGSSSMGGKRMADMAGVVLTVAGKHS